MVKNTLFWILMGIVVVIGGYLLLHISDIKTKETSLWTTYENTAYHYSIKYPQIWNVRQTLEEDRETVERSRMIELSSNSPSVGNGYVGITAWDPSKFDGLDQASVEFHKSLLVNLQSFAETARQKEIKDKSHILPDKKVGELQEVVFASKKAFSYTVTGSFDKYGGDGAKYIFVENKGIKFMIFYSLSARPPKEIASTFEFTN